MNSFLEASARGNDRCLAQGETEGFREAHMEDIPEAKHKLRLLILERKLNLSLVPIAFWALMPLIEGTESYLNV